MNQWKVDHEYYDKIEYIREYIGIEIEEYTEPPGYDEISFVGNIEGEKVNGRIVSYRFGKKIILTSPIEEIIGINQKHFEFVYKHRNYSRYYSGN